MKREIPGHIRKAFKSVDQYLPVVDVIVELVDARMPNGSRLKDFVKRLGKTSVIALAKSDLADEGETRRWLERFRNEGQACLAVDCRNRSSVKNLAEMIRNAAFTLKPGQKAPLRKVRRVMIIGVPNVGKSTLINSLAGRSAARAANMPGVTRSIQWIKLPGELELLDLPVFLISLCCGAAISSSSSTRFRGVIPIPGVSRRPSARFLPSAATSGFCPGILRLTAVLNASLLTMPGA